MKQDKKKKKQADFYALVNVLFLFFIFFVIITFLHSKRTPYIVNVFMLRDRVLTVMMLKVRASRLIGMRVLLDVGMLVGHLTDMKFDKKTGEVYALVVKPVELTPDMKKLFKWEGDHILIPTSTLKNIGDFIIIDKDKITMYR